MAASGGPGLVQMRGALSRARGAASPRGIEVKGPGFSGPKPIDKDKAVTGWDDPKVPYIPPPEWQPLDTGWMIDAVMPSFDVSDRQRQLIAAPPDLILPALVALELRRSWAMRLLFALKLAPELVGKQDMTPTGHRLADLVPMGLLPLGEVPGKELILGLIGRFWHPVNDLRRVTPEQFRRFGDRRCARLVWGFRIEPVPEDKSRPQSHMLVSELRAEGLSDGARWQFNGYWTMIRPFAGLILRQMLRAVQEAAEGAAPRPTPSTPPRWLRPQDG